MKRLTNLLLIVLTIFVSCDMKRQIVIEISDNANETVEFAAEQLSQCLSKIYPDYTFPVSSGFSENLQSIQIGITEDLKYDSTLEKESFKISNERNRGYIVGGSEKGVIFGVYALLEKLGCGFYLSHETIPESADKFDFSVFDIEDSPVYSDRIVFNWHNFLSGCTGWNLEDWQEWILQSAKMRYNTIMVHAYGNNPMYSFEYNGAEKPTGYLTTTRKGRDWGAQHVNDIRRMYGGEVFDNYVFGADAALVPDSEKEQTATALMQQVFQYAEMVGMDVNFAIDVDTRSANPQEVIKTLPKQALFSKKISSKGYFNKPEMDFLYVNPDVPEGYNYYKEQVKSLMETYPEIDVITVWVRRFTDDPNWATAWRSLKEKDFPEGWKKEYQELLKALPELKSDERAPSTFAISKIIKAFQKAVKELNYDVEIATGSWRFQFLPSANLIYPDDVTIIPLDWEILFYEDSVREQLAEIGKEHPMIPIVWAHHDDHRYVGKPYTPFDNFPDKLEQTHSKGFGIIHWTTRPLDLYFKSLANQVWKASKNEAVTETVQEFTKKVFQTNEPLMVKYLNEWLYKAPMFGRETSDYFIDPGKFVLGEHGSAPEEFIKGCNERIAILNEIDKESLGNEGKEMYNYFMGMEDFFITFIETHQQLLKADNARKAGEINKAIQIMDQIKPGRVIEKYANFSKFGNITRGEEALVSTMNLQWLPDFLDQKQLLGIEAVRYNFQPTSHDPLAQAPGQYTYFFEEDKTVWLGLGEKEINGVTAKYLEKDEVYTISNTVIESGKEFYVPFRSYRQHQLPAGEYELKILFPESTSKSFQIEVVSDNKIIQIFDVSVGKKEFLTKVQLMGDHERLKFVPPGESVTLSGLVLTMIE